MSLFKAPEPGSTIAVIGGSVIGLACAWLAARAGFDVAIYEPDQSGAAGVDLRVPTGGAAWVAGGMLAPFSEAWPGEDSVFALSVASLRRWPDFLDELSHHVPEGSSPPRVRTATATHLLAVDHADARDLETALTWAEQQSATSPGDIEKMSRATLRENEPDLSKAVRSAYRMAGEGSVDNRALLHALVQACDHAGVRWIDRAVDHVDDVDADRVILAAGCGSAALSTTTHLPTGLPIRPIKGEVIRLGVRPGCVPPPRSVVRALVRGRPIYLVPRDNGLVVGATQYEHGDDRQVTVTGVRDLLADAETIFPAVGEYEVREIIAGLRPMSPDNLPMIGPLPGSERTLCATGHGRNGIALTPITAEAILAWLTGNPPPPAALAAHPERCLPPKVAPPTSTPTDNTFQESPL